MADTPDVETLYLVDGSNQAFRAFFAIQTDMRAPDGFPTRALFGFSNMLLKLIRDRKPTYMAVVFDKGLSFRNELFPDYKGQRPDMPDDLRAQWPEFLPMSREFGITALAQSGYEADDIIGTLATRYAGPDLQVVVVSSDKDFGQLVGEHIKMLDVRKDEILGPAEIEAKWGVGPDKVIDLLSLMGDTSDNVPGVKGVGPKTAAKHLITYGTSAAVVEAAERGDIKGKTGERIAAAKDDVELSRRLVTIECDMDVDGVSSLDDLTMDEPDAQALAERFFKYNFGRLLAYARELGGEDAVGPTSPMEGATYTAVRTAAQLTALAADLRKAGRFAFDTETTSLIPTQARLVGMSFCWQDEAAVYVPIGHVVRDPDGGDDAEWVPAPENCPGALDVLAPLLADPSLKKTGQNLKYDLEVLRALGHDLGGIDGDTMLADYLIDVDRKHSLDKMAAAHLHHEMISFKDTAGEYDNDFSRVPVEAATAYAAEDAHAAWLLDAALVVPEGPDRVYRDIELPLIEVIADMELAGIGVDVDALRALSEELGGRIETHRVAIYEEAGEEFNINSTQQLARLLFEVRGLEPIKKTKSGFSTDAATLERLSVQGDALSRMVLEYRELAKLKSTYVDALPGHVHADGRIRTSFHQAVAATGRLSSNDPNLQNIPIRTDEGRRIRRCFVSKPGHRFLSADYSQVELRVLAHFCGEGPLVDAFRAGQDIHRRTAAEIFGVAMDFVSGEQRRAAKAINFGIVYGMSAFRLANDLGIPRREAQKYIRGYFKRYPQVKAYMDRAKEQAKELGYAETLFGRRRFVRGLDARNPVERGAAERIAINTPVQGTAADLIKLAMIRVHRRIKADFPGTALLLQVHDELFLEVPDGQVEAVRAALVEEMSQAAELAVPLVVDTGDGTNWADAH